MTYKLTCGCFRRWLWRLMITELTTWMDVIDWLTNHKLKEADFKTIMTLTSLKGIWYKINANENKLIQRGLSSVIWDIYILEEKPCLRGNKRFILHHNVNIRYQSVHVKVSVRWKSSLVTTRWRQTAMNVCLHHV